jgi:hypothetical protein
VRILNVKTQGVTVGAIGHDLRLAEELIEVTFSDFQGTPHTVQVHRDGPFSDPHAAVQAWLDGTIHPNVTTTDADQPAPAPASGAFE